MAAESSRREALHGAPSRAMWSGLHCSTKQSGAAEGALGEVQGKELAIKCVAPTGRGSRTERLRPGPPPRQGSPLLAGEAETLSSRSRVRCPSRLLCGLSPGALTHLGLSPQWEAPFLTLLRAQLQAIMDDFGTWSVKELRRYLRERNVSVEGMLEKSVRSSPVLARLPIGTRSETRSPRSSSKPHASHPPTSHPASSKQLAVWPASSVGFSINASMLRCPNGCRKGRRARVARRWKAAPWCSHGWIRLACRLIYAWNCCFVYCG